MHPNASGHPIVHLRHARAAAYGGIQPTDLGGPVFLFFINLKESL